MRSHLVSAGLILFAASLAIAQSASDQKPATVAEAQVFIDRANAELLKLTTDASHAEWTAETDITDDTEATTALVNEQFTARNAGADRGEPSLGQGQAAARAAPPDPADAVEYTGRTQGAETPGRTDTTRCATDRHVRQGQVLPRYATGTAARAGRQVPGHRRDLGHHGQIARPGGADEALGGLARNRRSHAARDTHASSNCKTWARRNWAITIPASCGARATT